MSLLKLIRGRKGEVSKVFSVNLYSVFLLSVLRRMSKMYGNKKDGLVISSFMTNSDIRMTISYELK